jgi:hypothetical protein
LRVIKWFEEFVSSKRTFDKTVVGMKNGQILGEKTKDAMK